MSGSLSVTCGPMFSGKSTKLYNDIFGKPPSKRLIFKPMSDTRHPERIMIHSGQYLSAIALDAEDGTMLPYVSEDIEHIYIDEIQFFLPWVIREIKQLVFKGVHISVYGLDLDYQGLSWSTTRELLAFADNVHKLKSSCQVCQKPASKTIRKETSGYKDQVFVGAADHYEPRCNEHFND